MRKIFKWVLLAFVALLVIGALGATFGDEEELDSTEAIPQEGDPDFVGPPAPEEDTEEASATAEESANAGLNEALAVGAVSYTAHSVETASNVGGDYGSNASGTYLLVDVTVKNTGDEALTIDSSFFTLLSDGKEYDPDSMATMLANDDGAAFFLEKVNPGIELTGQVAFDIPQEVADASGLQLQVSEGIFGTNTGVIDVK